MKTVQAKKKNFDTNFKNKEQRTITFLTSLQDIPTKLEKFNRNKKVLICNEGNHCRGNFKVVKKLFNIKIKQQDEEKKKMLFHKIV